MATASCLALSAAALAPQAAWAASTYTVTDEATLKAAILSANGNPGSSIVLGVDISVADPATMPALTQGVTINLGAFHLNDGRFNSSGVLNLTGSGQALLAGSNALGGDLNVTDSTLRLNSGVTLTVAGVTQFSGASTLWLSGAGSRLTANQIRFGATAGTETIRIENGGVFHATYTGASVQPLGTGPGTQVNVTITGAGSLMAVDGQLGIAVNSGAAASVTISNGGALTTASTLRIGSATGLNTTPPSVLVTGPGSSFTFPGLNFTQGTFDVLGGATVAATTFNAVGANAAARLLVSGPGSSVTSTGALTLNSAAGGGIATLTDGGALNVSGLVTLAGTAGRTGVINIGGTEGSAAAAAGSLNTTTLTFAAAGTGRLNFNHTDTNYSFSPAITGAGAINQVAGVTHLTGISSGFTGATTISGGELHVDGTLGGAISSVVVNSGGQLGGSGTIGGNVAITNGVLAPGNSPGTLTIAGNLTLAPASVLNFEFGQSNIVGGPMNDLTKVGGALTLDGTINVSVTAGGVFDTGIYRVMSYGGALTNNGLALGTAPGAGVTVQTSIPGQVNLVNTGGGSLSFWDGDAGGNAANHVLDGGNGAWTPASTNWTEETGGVNGVYTSNSFVVFAGAPGTVTSSGTINVTGMQFAVDGYHLRGGGIGLGAGAKTFRVGDGTADGKTYVATIDNALRGLTTKLVKADLGTLILTGGNNYGGGTQVSAGTLLINGNQSTQTAASQVDATGTLGGIGRLGGDVTVNGTLAPGDRAAPGKLTINGNLTLAAGSKLNYRLGQAGTAGGTLNDLLVVNGNLALDGTLNVTQSAGGTFGPGIYRLIDYTGALTDNGLDIGSLPAGFASTVQTSIANQINLLAAVAPSGGGGGGGGGGTPPALTFWDAGGQAADGSISGGDGTWTATGGQGWTNAAGAVNGVYANGGFAIFAGRSGLVTIDNSQGAVSASGMQFAADGYRLTGAPLTLVGPEAILRVGDATTAGAAFTATVDAPLTGAARLVKTDAGKLVLTAANSYTGGTDIQGGELAVNGSLDGSLVTVRNGATLSGSGAVGSVAVQAGGAIAPGQSIGVLTLNGSLSQAAGSVYRVQLDPSAGVADQLRATGAATLAGGAILQVARVGSGAYGVGAAYTVLHAGGGVTGTYNLTGDIGSLSAFLALRDSYDANNVYLTVAQTRPLASAGATANQVAAGAGADSLPGSDPVRGALLNLPDDASAQAAFDQVSGEPNASARAVLVTQSAAVRDATLARLQDAACGRADQRERDPTCADVAGRAAGWAQALGGWGHLDGGGGAAGVDLDTAGFLMGVDGPLGEWRIGGLAGYSRSSWDVDGRRASGDSDDYHLGLYGGRAWDRLSLKLGGVYTWHDISAQRSVAFANLSERLDAGYDASTVQAFGELGYRLGGEGVTWEPFAGLAHVRLRTDGFDETGGPAALSVQKETMQTTLGTLGVRPTTQVDLGSTRATLTGTLGWRHAFGDVVPTGVHSFTGGEPFTVKGAALARNAAVVGAGADFVLGRGGMARVSYGGQFSGKATDQQVRVDIRLTF